MAAKDFYATLGVAKDVSADDLKKAYRKLTRRFHPDRNPGNKQAEERFKDVGGAYDILSDPKKRELYDEFGEMSLTLGFDADRARRYKQAQAQAQAAASRGPQSFDDSDLDDIGDPRATNFDDFLSRMFGRRSGAAGGGAQRRGTRGGIDISGEIHVAMMDALAGTTVQMRVEVSDGDQRSITVRVPAGIGDGGKLRVRGHGGAGDPPGDLLLTVIVDKHPRISREGDDLRMIVPVTAFEAYRGGPVDVRTPWGTVALKLPAGAQNGSTLRVRGHGVRVANKTPGDLLVVLDVRLPPAGDAKLLEALADLQAGQDPRSASGL